MIRTSVLTGGALLVAPHAFSAQSSKLANQLPNGRKVKVLPFVGEGDVPMDTPIGSELDGRLFTDLSVLGPATRIIPTDRFYIRTRASELLATQTPWKIVCDGHVRRPLNLSLHDLQQKTRPMGLHVMECAGNIANVHFGMVGVAEWDGVPIAEILDRVAPQPNATYLTVSGFDQYARPSLTSLPGASWVFSIEQLKAARAFLATRMNGAPLAADHGAPVRLVVPGWYGCTCIKWVDQLTFVDESVPATSQMREYAGRTLQDGMPAQAKDYQPAVIDAVAIPIRVEQWKVGGRPQYRVVGILWGGTRTVRVLEIQLGSDGVFVPVHLDRQGEGSWTFWTYDWTPTRTGLYSIRLRVKEPVMRCRRLDSDYYLRTVQITEM